MKPRRGIYVGDRMWNVLCAVVQYEPRLLPLGILCREAYPLDPSSKGRKVVDALLERGMLEWACPDHRDHPSKICRLRVTERGLRAQLDRRGRKAAR